MKKLTETYYCDYCGKECEHTDFILPCVDRNFPKDKNGTILSISFYDDTINKKPVDICPNCQKKIAYATRLTSAIQL